MQLLHPHAQLLHPCASLLMFSPSDPALSIIILLLCSHLTLATNAGNHLLPAGVPLLFHIV